MDFSDLRQAVEAWITELRGLARRIPSASTATRDATLLPLVFLAVGLLGGLRIGESEMWRAPSLFSLVVAVLMIGALNRHGALALERLLNSSRSTLDLKGLLMLLAVVLASAQVFELTTPNGGLLRMAVYGLYSLVLLAFNTRAIAADRIRLLRSCIVIFALTFTFKFVLLPSSPVGGWREFLCRLVPTCEPRHPVTGYLAFFTLFLYVLALARLAPMVGDISDRPSNGTASGLEQMPEEPSTDSARRLGDAAAEAPEV